QPLFFCFQAEDGIRDFHVTGVQTCALPIWPSGPCTGSTTTATETATDSSSTPLAPRTASSTRGGRIPGTASASRTEPSPSPPSQIGRASGRERECVSGGGGTA